MKIIAYGYKIPELTDTDFWQSVVFDFTRLSDHNHNGVNSALIVPGAVDTHEFEFLLGDWVSNAPGPGFRLDFIFPVPWEREWIDQEPCPVRLVVRENATNDLVLLGTTRTPAGDGVRLLTHAPFDGYAEVT